MNKADGLDNNDVRRAAVLAFDGQGGIFDVCGAYADGVYPRVAGSANRPTGLNHCRFVRARRATLAFHLLIRRIKLFIQCNQAHCASS